MRLKTSKWVENFHVRSENAHIPPANKPENMQPPQHIRAVDAMNQQEHDPKIAESRLSRHAGLPKYLGQMKSQNWPIIIKSGYPGGCGTPLEQTIAISSPESPPTQPPCKFCTYTAHIAAAKTPNHISVEPPESGPGLAIKINNMVEPGGRCASIPIVGLAHDSSIETARTKEGNCIMSILLSICAGPRGPVESFEG